MRFQVPSLFIWMHKETPKQQSLLGELNSHQYPAEWESARNEIALSNTNVGTSKDGLVYFEDVNPVLHSILFIA